MLLRILLFVRVAIVMLNACIIVNIMSVSQMFYFSIFFCYPCNNASLSLTCINKESYEMINMELLYFTLYIIYKIKVMFLTKLVSQGNITVVHRSTNAMFHVFPEMYPFLPSGITILTGS